MTGSNKTYLGLRVNCSILTGFKQIWGLLTVTRRHPVSNFMDIRTVGAALLHADRWTDTTKAMGAFSVYANTHKKGNKNDSYCCLYTAFRLVSLSMCRSHDCSVKVCVVQKIGDSCLKSSLFAVFGTASKCYS